MSAYFEKNKISENQIDEELMSSFPASDPPSWTLGSEPDKSSMKVVRIHEYGGPEQLCYENMPIPPVGTGQILVRVFSASVNPIDYKLASGAIRPVMNNQAVKLPWIPGGDFCGKVEKIGPTVMGINIGDIVYGNCPGGGAYAEFVLAQAQNVSFKPQTLDSVQSASIPIAGLTAWQALFDHGQLENGQTVLIHGASGGVGSFAIQLSRWKNAHVIATGSAEHMEYLRHLGAQETIDYKATAFDSVVKDVDLVVDLVGGQTQEESFKVLKAGGYLISTVNEPSHELAKKYQIKSEMVVMKPSMQQLSKLAELIDGGLIKPNVSKIYPLSLVKDAWADILSHHTLGKIVLEVAKK